MHQNYEDTDRKGKFYFYFFETLEICFLNSHLFPEFPICLPFSKHIRDLGVISLVFIYYQMQFLIYIIPTTWGNVYTHWYVVFTKKVCMCVLWHVCAVVVYLLSFPLFYVLKAHSYYTQGLWDLYQDWPLYLCIHYSESKNLCAIEILLIHPSFHIYIYINTYTYITFTCECSIYTHTHILI